MISLSFSSQALNRIGVSGTRYAKSCSHRLKQYRADGLADAYFLGAGNRCGGGKIDEIETGDDQNDSRYDDQRIDISMATEQN
jgi:hypothetical protein